ILRSYRTERMKASGQMSRRLRLSKRNCIVFAATILIALFDTGAISATPQCGMMTTRNVYIDFQGESSACSVYAGTCSTDEPITFTAATNGYSFSCAPHTFQWSFGDGTTTSGQTVTHKYSSPGSYSVGVAISKEVQTFKVSDRVKVNPWPSFDFT